MEVHATAAEAGTSASGISTALDTGLERAGAEIVTSSALPASVADMTVGAQSIVDRINAQHRLAQSAASDAIERAIECGDLLLNQKDRVGHGNFMRWVADHCEFSQAKANNYMHLAKNPTVARKMKAMRHMYDSGRTPQPRKALPASVSPILPDATPTSPALVEQTVDQAAEVLRRQKDNIQCARLLREYREAKRGLERAQIAYNNVAAVIQAAARQIDGTKPPQEAQE